MPIPWGYAPGPTNTEHDLRTVAPTAASETTISNAEGSKAARKSASAFSFGPRALSGNRKLRRLRREDIDGVVALAFEEYYEGAAELLQATSATASLEGGGGGGGGGSWGATWQSAVSKGGFDQIDVDRLVDW